MTQHPKRLFLVGLLATILGATAIAQTPPAAPAAGEAATQPAAGKQRHHMNPEQFHQRMTERKAKRMTELKAKLKLTPAQESAWNTYTAATKPPALDGRRHMDREAMAKLTTPERIDRMQAMQAERQAAMRERGEATKAFYAQLTPEQQKTFDTATLRQGRHHMKGHHG